MGLGVLEDRKLEHVPGGLTHLTTDKQNSSADRGFTGTAYVLDDETRRVEESLTISPNLKYDTTGRTPIILVPQPSDDPNDPLVCIHSLHSVAPKLMYHRTGRYGAATSSSSCSHSSPSSQQPSLPFSPQTHSHSLCTSDAHSQTWPC
jgi:hypothetical protein